MALFLLLYGYSRTSLLISSLDLFMTFLCLSSSICKAQSWIAALKFWFRTKVWRHFWGFGLVHYRHIEGANHRVQHEVQICPNFRGVQTEDSGSSPPAHPSGYEGCFCPDGNVQFMLVCLLTTYTGLIFPLLLPCWGTVFLLLLTCSREAASLLWESLIQFHRKKSHLILA